MWFVAVLYVVWSIVELVVVVSSSCVELQPDAVHKLDGLIAIVVVSIAIDTTFLMTWLKLSSMPFALITETKLNKIGIWMEKLKLNLTL